jgi:TRAP-type uncharacterized transport system substrate-binding protein
MEEKPNNHLHRLAAPLMEIFGISRGPSIAIVLLALTLLVVGIYWFIHSAPPRRIILTGGAPGSSFETNAWKYKEILKRSGVELVILPSKGSIENLERLDDPKFNVDVGFVQGGVTNKPDENKLVSLGSINYEPLLLFYRAEQPTPLLSSFAGRRLAIGPVGSGTHALALQLLGVNGITPGGATSVEELGGDDAGKALIAGKIDAAFLMSDSTSSRVMSNLLHTAGIQLFDFTQAEGYTRRITYLNKLILPAGSLDFGKNIPARDINLVGPTVEIIARPSLHPALVDLIIEAAQETNSAPGIFRRRREFPAPIEHDFPISSEATRYYAAGKKFLAQHLGFWLASEVNRILVVFVPFVVVMIPAVKLIPATFRWRMQMRINRWYRELLALERNAQGEMTVGKQRHLDRELAHIEKEVNRMRVPASFADQFYNLRGHIIFVRQMLMPPAPADEEKPAA